MKNILLVSPVPLSNEPSGISIRIDEMKTKFKSMGMKTKISDTFEEKDFKTCDGVYILVSTKSNSISSQVSNYSKKWYLIVDLYTPIFLEKEAHLSKYRPQDWLTLFNMKKTVSEIIRSGDYFLVANKRQKEYWHKTSKKLNVPISKNKIFVLPTGAPKMSIVKSQKSNVILWFGGIYPWMNPKPLVEAFSRIVPQNYKWKLRILGGFHPKTGYLKLYNKVLEKTQKIIPQDQLEIIPWQKLDDLPNFLKDVVFAVHLPKKTKEDYYAHRVRLLTLLSSGIPALTSGQDVISKLIVENQAGLKISPNPQSISGVLTFLIKNPKKIKIFSKNALKIEPIFIGEQQDRNTLKYFI